MNGKKKISAVILLSIFPVLSLFGQLHESIKVDGKYIPDVIRIDRIFTFPKVYKSTVATTPIGYEEKGVAASFNPSLVIMPATGWQSNHDFSDRRGYLEFGTGSWLNTTLSAGYRFIDNKNTILGVRLQHNSTSLWKPEISGDIEKVTQYRYDESIGLYGSYNFEKYGRIDAAMDWHLGYFNYYGCGEGYFNRESGNSGGESGGVKGAPRQSLNDIAARIDWISEMNPVNGLIWNVTARIRQFGYGEFMTPLHKKEKGSKETDIGIDGGLKMRYGEKSHLGIEGNFDYLAITQQGLDNYAMLRLTPFYRFTNGNMDIRIGADVDMTFNAGLKGDCYPFLHIAPDVRFGVQSKKVGFYIDLLGGSRMNTLSHLHQLDYYGLPVMLTTRPVYSPLDAAAGLNFGPFSGFSFGLRGRYKVNRNVPLGGWYMAWLNYGDTPMEGIDTYGLEQPEINYCGDTEGINLHGYSVSGFLRYEHGRKLSVSAEGGYQPQEGKKGYFNGYDRAEVTADFKVSFRPVDRLSVGLNYNIRGKRRAYTTVSGIAIDRLTGARQEERRLCYLDLPDLNLLNLSLSWEFDKNFSIWFQGDNLLNRHVDYLPMQPTQGMVLTGGVKLLF